MSKQRKIARSGRSKAGGGAGTLASHSVDLNCDPELDKLGPQKNPLMIELVLTRVLKNLDTNDLLRCSEVNKLWLREARKILRQERKCFARIRIHDPCEDLQKFSRMLAGESLNPADLPYNGLFIPFESEWHVKDVSGCLKTYDHERGRNVPDEVDYEHLLNYKFKFLHVKWLGYAPLDECPAALCIPRLVVNNFDTLEELQFENPHPSQPFFLQEANLSSLPDGFIENGSMMPKLKVIRGIDMNEVTHSMDKVCQLVRHAPNLEQLLIPVTRTQFREKYLKPEHYKVIKALCFSCGIAKHAERLERFARTEPTLRHLIVKYPRIGHYDYEDQQSDGLYDSDDPEFIWTPPIERCWISLHCICWSSANTLEKLRLPATVAVQQMNWSWIEFPNLTFLALEIPFKKQKLEQFLHLVMRHYNFTARFPKLTSITVDDPHDNFYDTKDRSYRRFRELKEDLPSDPAANIKTLNYNDHVTAFGIRYLAKLFPHVTELNLGPEGVNIPMPYGIIWKEMPQLEKLFVFETFWGEDMGPGLKDCVNYDADFLGIYEAEAELMQKMSPKLVKDLNIVPMKPSIINMKHLRELTVSFMHNRAYDPWDDDHFFLSPAGCILTVNRMPQLKFKLICSWAHEGVKPLRKYVDVEIRDPVWE